MGWRKSSYDYFAHSRFDLGIVGCSHRTVRRIGVAWRTVRNNRSSDRTVRNPRIAETVRILRCDHCHYIDVLDLVDLARKTGQRKPPPDELDKSTRPRKEATITNKKASVNSEKRHLTVLPYHKNEDYTSAVVEKIDRRTSPDTNGNEEEIAREGFGGATITA